MVQRIIVMYPVYIAIYWQKYMLTFSIRLTGNRRDYRRRSERGGIPADHCQQRAGWFIFGAEQSRRFGSSEDHDPGSRRIVIVAAGAVGGKCHGRRTPDMLIRERICNPF